MATRDLTENSRRVIRNTERILNFTEKELVKSYKLALKDIRSELARLYDAFDFSGEFTKAQATKFMRLSGIEASVVEIMKPYLVTNERLIGQAAATSFDNGYFTSAWALDQASGVSIGFGLIDENAVLAASGIGGNLGDLEEVLGKATVDRHQKLLDNAFTNYTQDAQKWISQDIRQGIIQGESIPQISKRLRKGSFVKSYHQAERIARTETLRAMDIGAEISYDEARDAGVGVTETWDATLDDRTRPDHAAADGAIKDQETGLYDVPWGQVEGPRLSGQASQDINCRCISVPSLAGFTPEVRRIRDEGIQPYQTFPQWAERNGITQNRFGQKYDFK